MAQSTCQLVHLPVTLKPLHRTAVKELGRKVNLDGHIFRWPWHPAVIRLVILLELDCQTRPAKHGVEEAHRVPPTCCETDKSKAAEPVKRLPRVGHHVRAVIGVRQAIHPMSLPADLKHGAARHASRKREQVSWDDIGAVAAVGNAQP